MPKQNLMHRLSHLLWNDPHSGGERRDNNGRVKPGRRMTVLNRLVASIIHTRSKVNHKRERRTVLSRGEKYQVTSRILALHP